MLRRLFALLLVPMLGFALVACGDDDDDDGAADVTTTSEAAEGEDAVDIELKDYAFAVSGALTQGGSFRVRNTGKEFHMIGLGKFKDGKDFDDLVALLQQMGEQGGGAGEDEGQGEEEEATTTTAAGGSTIPGEGGEEGEEEDPLNDILDEVEAPLGTFMGPGQSAEINAGDVLEPGNYGLLCFVNVEGDPETPHFARGMVGELEVAEGSVNAPVFDTTYQIAPGKAITGPGTLTAGRHVIKIEAQSGADISGLEPGLAKANAGVSLAALDRAFDAFDEGLPVGAAGKLPGQLVVANFDMGEAEALYLTVDLTPGTYYLVAEDTDEEAQRVNPPRESITIRVT